MPNRGVAAAASAAREEMSGAARLAGRVIPQPGRPKANNKASAANVAVKVAPRCNLIGMTVDIQFARQEAMPDEVMA
jgi:hypothetical protein